MPKIACRDLRTALSESDSELLEAHVNILVKAMDGLQGLERAKRPIEQWRETPWSLV